MQLRSNLYGTPPVGLVSMPTKNKQTQHARGTVVDNEVLCRSRGIGILVH